MAKQANMLDAIQAAALDPASDLTSVLRQCIALGGQTGSASLREWATRELKGYGRLDELPDYRETAAPLHIDGFAGYNQVRGQQWPITSLPEFAQEAMGRGIDLRQPLAELIQIADRHEAEVRLMPAGADDLVAYMNSEHAEAEAKEPLYGGGPTQRIERLYWSVSSTVFASVADVVRTTLVELVAEMRAAMSASEVVPSYEVTEQAVSVAIYGGDRHNIVIGHAGGHSTQVVGDGDTTETITAHTAPQESQGRRWFWWVFGVATLVGAVAAVLALLM